jgi:hypothetical protein
MKFEIYQNKNKKGQMKTKSITSLENSQHRGMRRKGRDMFIFRAACGDMAAFRLLQKT